MYAASMAHQLGSPEAQITLLAKWTGLTGRTLTHLSGTRMLFESYVSHQDTYSSHLTVRADHIGDALPELVHNALQHLYELFDFFQLPPALVNDELTTMRARQF